MQIWNARCKGDTCDVQRVAINGLDWTLGQPKSVIIGKELWWLVQSANDYRLVLFRPTRLAALLVLGPSLLVQRKWSNLNLVRLPVWFTSSSDWNWNYKSNWIPAKFLALFLIFRLLASAQAEKVVQFHWNPSCGASTCSWSSASNNRPIKDRHLRPAGVVSLQGAAGHLMRTGYWGCTHQPTYTSCNCL